MSSSEALPHIVLVGAGHAHLMLLQLLRRKKIEGVKVTLISEHELAFAPLMFPYVLSGEDDPEAATIDVRSLCESAGAEFVGGAVADLSLTDRQVLLDEGDPIPFRLLSLNVGSRPAFSEDPSVKEFALSIKPFQSFLGSLNDFVGAGIDEDVKTMVIVGGGKNGVELAFGLLERLKNRVLIHLVHARSRLLQDFHYRTAGYGADALEARGVVLHLDECVTEVTRQSVICESGLEVPGDIVLWAAHPEPCISWPETAGLAVDDEGFVLIRDTLQSASHTYVFAVGECATLPQADYPRTPRAAIEQGKVLYQNLRRWIAGDPLVSFNGTTRFKDFVYAGRNDAIAEWGQAAFESKWVSKLMKRSVRRFVDDCRGLR